jgi:hypothetical protein
MKRFKIFKLMKKSGRRYTLETGLTESEAQIYVQRDIKENGHSPTKMICYTAQ